MCTGEEKCSGNFLTRFSSLIIYRACWTRWNHEGRL